MSKNGKETPLKIFLAVLDADKALREADIVKATGLPKQLVSYHIPLMVKDGLLVPVDIKKIRYYAVQMIFLNDDLFNKLLDSIVPVVKLVASSLVYEHTENDRESVIRNNMIAFLSTVSRKVK
jgi:hypothetical protein